MYKAANNVEVYPELGCMRLYTDNEQIGESCKSLPKVTVTKTAKGFVIQMPMVDKMCRIAQNLGFHTLFASPFWVVPKPKIEGKYEAMRHQLITAAYMILHPRCFILSDCRLGKTGSAIIALDYLQRMQAIKGGILVITTVTTMRSVWMAGISSTLPDASIHVVHGKNKFEALSTPADWYITNYDSIRLNLDAFTEAVKFGRISCLLIDELTHVGNASSQRHQAISTLANKTGLDYVIGMTGSPGCRPEPVYGMVRTVNPSAMPYKTKIGWLNHTTWQYGPQPYMRKPVSNCAQLIHEVLQPSIRFKKEDVLDLPPIVFQDRDCDLSKEQTKMIKEFREDAVAFAQSGVVITAANAAVLMNKLLQVPLGFVMHEGEITDLKCDARNQVLLDIINESDRKTVIFCMFKHRLAMLQDMIAKAGISVAKIDGGVTGDERSKILAAFAKEENPKVLVCHPTTVGYGTELSAADTLVLDGPPILGDFSYTQTLERLSSPKQQADKISIIKVSATREERLLFRKLEAGQTAGKAVASLFESMR